MTSHGCHSYENAVARRTAMASRASAIASDLNRLGADAWTAEDQQNLIDFLGEYHYGNQSDDGA